MTKRFEDLEPGERMDPLEDLPVFDLRAVQKWQQAVWGEAESEEYAPEAQLARIVRFATGNMAQDIETIRTIGHGVITNLTPLSHLPLWLVCATLYLLGVYDGCRLSKMQAEVDRDQVAKGRVM